MCIFADKSRVRVSVERGQHPLITWLTREGKRLSVVKSTVEARIKSTSGKSSMLRKRNSAPWKRNSTLRKRNSTLQKTPTLQKKVNTFGEQSKHF